MKRILWTLIFVAAQGMPLAVYAHEQGRWPGMMGWGYGMGTTWFIFMLLFWIAVLAAVILLVRWLIMPSGPKKEGLSEDSAVEILKKRYARGEINREEFEEKKRDLGK